MIIFVGNLNGQATELQLQDLFKPFGLINSVSIIKDFMSGRPKGFAFIEMPERNNAEDAIGKLNNTPFHGQFLTVNEARASNNDDIFGKTKH